MATPELSCNICGSTKSKLCTKCRSSAYCSVECQRADLDVHKLLCSQIQSSPSSGPTYKRAILFPTSLEKPELIWVECQEKENHAGEKFESPEVGKHLGGKVSLPEVMSVRYNNRRKSEMKNSLRLMFRAGAEDDGLQANQCIPKVLGRKPRQPWNGPVVVLRNRGNELDPAHYEDITLHDYRQAIDHLFWYKTDSSYNSDEDLNQSTKKMQGVRINCTGDRSHFKKDWYEPVEVPGEHPVYNAPIAQMSLKMGIPLQAMSYPLHPKWKGTFVNGEGASDNQSATYMYLETKPSSSWFGFAPPEWQNNVGSVLVVRSDRIPLTPEQTMALCDFFQFTMSPFFEDALGVGERQRTKEEALGFLTRKRFEHNWYEMKEMMAERKYLNWTKGSKSPYEMF